MKKLESTIAFSGSCLAAQESNLQCSDVVIKHVSSTTEENENTKYVLPPGRGLYTEKARQSRLDFIMKQKNIPIMQS